MAPSIDNFKVRTEVLERKFFSQLLSRVGEPYFLGGLGTWRGYDGIDCNNLMWSGLYDLGIWHVPTDSKGQAHIGTPLPTGGYMGAYYEFLRRQPYRWNSRLSFIVERWVDIDPPADGFDVSAVTGENLYNGRYHKYQHIAACWDKKVVIQAAAGNAYDGEQHGLLWNRAARILGDSNKMEDLDYPGEVVICDYPTYLETVYERNVTWFPEIVYLDLGLLQVYVLGL